MTKRIIQLCQEIPKVLEDSIIYVVRGTSADKCPRPESHLEVVSAQEFNQHNFRYGHGTLTTRRMTNEVVYLGDFRYTHIPYKDFLEKLVAENNARVVTT